MGDLLPESRINLARRVLNVGCTGADSYAEAIINCLDIEGVLHSVHQIASAESGTCPVTIHKGQRTCVAILDACERFSTAHLKDLIKTSPHVPSILCYYTTAFLSEVNHEAVLFLAQHASQNNLPFVFNMAAEYLFEEEHV